MDQPHLEGAEQQQEMSFVDHLEELRWHIIRSVASILVFATAAFLAKGFVFHDIILAPSRTDFLSYQMMCKVSQYFGSSAFCIEDLGFTIQSRQMSGQFSMHIMVSLVLGLALAFPYAFWEIWRFVKPGLYPQEQQNSRGAVFWVSVLFAMGLLFGYYVVAPISINFLAGYQVDPSIVNEFDLSSYISTLTTLCLACAFMFELPVIVYFFTKAGLLSPEIMKLYRRHAIIVILIVSAVITPPDVISQLLISFPLIILYEVSISVSRGIIQRDLKRLNENNA
ncbi:MULTISPECIES: twin-arginine translocase subunit TatC [Pontibacter]|uniref:Sec-independent protein translocase protein TatC n=1 Tax=Pontibacter lucknowensis TaxID=1077936 RepID=A0A1N6UST4_9BACT|nr:MULTISPECIES: twin-arginine translocase subunit TatC [Pontibacter]EJF10499.1 Sec-independent protein translocase subunit TatC [Pontibacter sp. BAB1700]SIQ68690.1 Sec-independent protein translocase TatC [Pontibacter lucknowensis]